MGKRHQIISGFTLIEVLAALAFFSIAMLGFHQGQSGAVRLAKKAETKAQAAGLAQFKMTETELGIQKKGLTAFGEEESGSFDEDGLKRFKWKRKMIKADLSCLFPVPKAALEGNQTGFFQQAQKILEEQVRKIEIIIEWEEAGKPQKLSLNQLYVRFDDLPSF